MSGKTVLIYDDKEVFKSPRGSVTICMKLQQLLVPDPTQGLFLDQYVLSWIAYRSNDPTDRVLVDCHEPHGIHVHVNDEPRRSFEATSLAEARSYFDKEVILHFGMLEVVR